MFLLYMICTPIILLRGTKYGAQNIHSVTKTSGNLILNLIYILIILDYMTLKVNKFVCFKNNEGSYEVHNIVYNS